jgi:hypothetical protein
LAPLIVSLPHEKNLLSPDEFFCEQSHICLDTFTLTIGPDNVPFEFGIFYGEETGDGVVSITEETTSRLVGNVVFKKTSDELCILTGATSVQISSAMIDEDYRGFALATTAYGKLAEYFHVVSDSVQTVGGAALWKNKIAATPSLTVHVIVDCDKTPRMLPDPNNEIQVYDSSKVYLEKLIWSSKDQKTFELAGSLGIESSVGEHHQSRVLIAKRKDNPQH